MPKRKKKPEKSKAPFRPCSYEGCLENGEFRAPKTRMKEDDARPDYWWFCLEHIREYNQAWDFFRGLSESEVMRFQKDAVHGHRPTWQTAQRVSHHMRKLQDAVERFSNGFSSEGKSKREAREIAPEEKSAMEILGLSYPISQKQIKQRYKELVKLHHPDLSDDKETAEEKIKDINRAYTYLKKSSLIH